MQVERSMAFVRKSLGEVVPEAEYLRLLEERPDVVVSPNSLRRYYGSLHAALADFGMRPPPQFSLSQLTDEQLLEPVIRICKAAGGPLSVRGFDAMRETDRNPPDPTGRNLSREWGRRYGDGTWLGFLEVAGFPKT